MNIDWKIVVTFLEVAIITLGLWLYLGKPTFKEALKIIKNIFFSVFQKHEKINGSKSIIKNPIPTRPQVEMETINERLSKIETSVFEIKNVLNIRMEKEKTKSVFDDLTRKNEKKNLSDADKALINVGFDDLKERFAEIRERLEKTSQPSELVLKAADSLDAVKTILEIVQALKTTEHVQVMRDSDKQFFKESLSWFINDVNAAIQNSSIGDVQMEKLSKTLNAQYDQFLHKLNDVLNNHSYKECPSCHNVAVPKGALVCPWCREDFEKKTISESK